MLSYASNDVIYLPKIFNIMLESIKKLPGISFDKVMEECQLYLKYAEMNISITEKSRLLIEDTEIQGLLKYFQFT